MNDMEYEKLAHLVAEDSGKNLREGWDVFDCGRGYEIQADDDDGAFESDDAALRWVMARSSCPNSLRHNRALALMNESLRREREAEAEQAPDRAEPRCEHSACSQNFIDTGDRACITPTITADDVRSVCDNAVDGADGYDEDDAATRDEVVKLATLLHQHAEAIARLLSGNR